MHLRLLTKTLTRKLASHRPKIIPETILFRPICLLLTISSMLCLREILAMRECHFPPPPPPPPPPILLTLQFLMAVVNVSNSEWRVTEKWRRENERYNYNYGSDGLRRLIYSWDVSLMCVIGFKRVPWSASFCTVSQIERSCWGKGTCRNGFDPVLSLAVRLIIQLFMYLMMLS